VEKVLVSSKNHKEHISTIFGQNARFCNVKASGTYNAMTFKGFAETLPVIKKP
jgi:hypothetical protein